MIRSRKSLFYLISLTILGLIFLLFFTITARADDRPTVEWIDGEWWAVNGGEIDYAFSGLAPNEYGWWVVKDGRVDFGFEGVVSNEFGDWVCQGGCVNFGINSIIYVNNNGDEGWWLVAGGRVIYETTVSPNEYGWWVIRNGKVDFGFNGIAANAFGDWFCQGGQVNFAVNSVVFANNNDDEGWWLVREGRVIYETTLAPNEYGWWYINNGKVDFSFNGLTPNEYGWWVVRGGRVDFDFNGVASNEFGDWVCQGGCVNFGINSIIYVNNNGVEGWWLVKGGSIAYETTVAPNDYGWWYVKDGKVDFSYNGEASNEYGTWDIVGGKVRFPDEMEGWAKEIYKLAVTDANASMETKLRQCFIYVAHGHFGYELYRVPHYREYDWPQVYARDLRDRGASTCHGFAALFGYLAKLCGYEHVYWCHNGGHGWVEINNLVYDPIFYEQPADPSNRADIYAIPYNEAMTTYAYLRADFMPMTDYAGTWRYIEVPAF